LIILCAISGTYLNLSTIYHIEEVVLDTLVWDGDSISIELKMGVLYNMSVTMVHRKLIDGWVILPTYWNIFIGDDFYKILDIDIAFYANCTESWLLLPYKSGKYYLKIADYFFANNTECKYEHTAQFHVVIRRCNLWVLSEPSKVILDTIIWDRPRNMPVIELKAGLLYRLSITRTYYNYSGVLEWYVFIRNSSCYVLFALELPFVLNKTYSWFFIPPKSGKYYVDINNNVRCPNFRTSKFHVVIKQAPYGM